MTVYINWASHLIVHEAKFLLFASDTVQGICVIFFSGSFRIKQMNSGRCWAADDTNENVVLSSKCIDLFQFTKDSGLLHVSSGKKVLEENGAFSLKTDR